MAIFKFEMKQYRNAIIVWSIACSVAIILLLPLFNGFISEKTISMLGILKGNRFIDAMGVDLDSFLTPIGIYSYINTFVLLACAVNGMNIGISIIAKEHIQNTMDFLMTKPYSRNGVYLSKLLAGICATLITGFAYFIVSWISMEMVARGDYVFKSFALIALSFTLIQSMYLVLGMLIAVIVPRIKSPLQISMGAAYVTYIMGTFSRVVHSSLARCFSPFFYFNSSYISAHGSYEIKYLLLFFILVFTFIFTSYLIYVKKDIKMVL